MSFWTSFVKIWIVGEEKNCRLQYIGRYLIFFYAPIRIVKTPSKYKSWFYSQISWVLLSFVTNWTKEPVGGRPSSEVAQPCSKSDTNSENWNKIITLKKAGFTFNTTHDVLSENFIELHRVLKISSPIYSANRVG